MEYNDGQIHENFYLESKEKKIEIAKEFSEGNLLLEQALLFLWDNNIKTFGCCNGHGEYSYIVMEVNDQSKALISEIIEEIIENQIEEIDIDFYNSKKNSHILRASFTMVNDKIKNYIFQSIQSKGQSQKINLQNINNRFLEYAIYLHKFVQKHELYFRYNIDYKEMLLGFFKGGTTYGFYEDAILLSDILNDLQQTGKLPLEALKCDNESLLKFLSIVIPGYELQEKNHRINMQK